MLSELKARSCFSSCSGIHLESAKWDQATRSFAQAGLGLRSAARDASAGYRASVGRASAQEPQDLRIPSTPTWGPATRLPFKMPCPPSTPWCLSLSRPVRPCPKPSVPSPSWRTKHAGSNISAMPQFLPKPSFAPKLSQVHTPSLLRSLLDALAWSRLRLLLNSATVSAYQMPLKTRGAQSVMESLTATRTMLALAVLVGNAPSAILLLETSMPLGR